MWPFLIVLLWKLCSPLPINFKLFQSKYYLQFFFAKIKHAYTLKTSWNTVHPSTSPQRRMTPSIHSKSNIYNSQFLQITVSAHRVPQFCGTFTLPFYNLKRKSFHKHYIISGILKVEKENVVCDLEPLWTDEKFHLLILLNIVKHLRSSQNTNAEEALIRPGSAL